MSSSILTAASALRNHQTFMNVLANNIANMNTVSFKSSRVTFQDVFSQTLRGSTAPNEAFGGINPTQMGLGMLLGGITTNMGQGTLQNTGRTMDLAITGTGFLIYQGTQQPIYSRDGSLSLDADGNLVNLSTGLRLQGWMADEQGDINPAGNVEDITIPVGSPMTAAATTNITMAGNLDAGSANGSTVSTSVQVYDSLGNAHLVDLTFAKTANNTWTATLASSDPTLALPNPNLGNLVFDANGRIQTPADGDLTFNATLTNGAATPQAVTLNFSNLSQLDTGGTDRLYVTNQDGRAPGEMVDFNINSLGDVVGVYSNGTLKILGKLAMAEFVNPAGLTKLGQNGYVVSANSGDPQITEAGERSQVQAGFLEMSNVDLTLEFSDMIRAQRGFQANSRVVSSSDQMLQELVNLVR
jgi:flagellar hook protein FlgE